MRAIQVGSDPGRTLHWAEAADPELGSGQVLIRARATAVNRADLMQRAGRYPPPAGASEVLGLEVAGDIERLGEGAYDVCSNCGKEIEKERREVLPTTTLCSACAGPR